MIAGYVLEALGVHGLHEGAPRRHPEISGEVLLLAEHRHVVVEVLARLVGNRRVNLNELLESEELLILRNHDVGRFGRTRLDHSFEALTEVDL